jgi:hypothetical protein
VGDDIIVRINPMSGELENVEILFFSTRLLRDDAFEVPVVLEKVAKKHSALIDVYLSPLAFCF